MTGEKTSSKQTATTTSDPAPRRDSTLRNGLRLVEALSMRGAMSLGDLSRETGIGKATAHRLLQTLSEEGYVDQDAETSRYAATMRIWEVAMVRSEQPDRVSPCLPAMQRLRDLSRETVILGLIDGDEILYLHRLDSPEAVRTFTRVGDRAPAHCVATGKAVLAFDPAGEERWSTLTLDAFGSEPITDHNAFAADMKATRDRGHSINRGEWRGGVRAIGAPIRGWNGRVRMALSIAGPAERMPDDRIAELAPLVMAAADDASVALQGRKDNS